MRALPLVLTFVLFHTSLAHAEGAVLNGVMNLLERFPTLKQGVMNYAAKNPQVVAEAMKAFGGGAAAPAPGALPALKGAAPAETPAAKGTPAAEATPTRASAGTGAARPSSTRPSTASGVLRPNYVVRSHPRRAGKRVANTNEWLASGKVQLTGKKMQTTEPDGSKSNWVEVKRGSEKGWVNRYAVNRGGGGATETPAPNVTREKPATPAPETAEKPAPEPKEKAKPGKAVAAVPATKAEPKTNGKECASSWRELQSGRPRLQALVTRNPFQTWTGNFGEILKPGAYQGANASMNLTGFSALQGRPTKTAWHMMLCLDPGSNQPYFNNHGEKIYCKNGCTKMYIGEKGGPGDDFTLQDAGASR